tara:strand:+ start:117 stop:293 length:177 start_codon:yes stop_codon:yes gene_type:complete
MSNNELLQKQAINVMELIEDTVEMLCDEHVISGEKVWTMVGALADIKLQEFPLDEEEE